MHLYGCIFSWYLFCMFTGLIEDIGCIKNIKSTPDGKILDVEVNFDTKEVKIGDSIAINGACQTVIKIEGKILTFEAMNETIRRTNFSNLKNGELVNVERAMKLNSRLDGHLVSGHIDTTSKLAETKKDGVATIFKFECDTDLIIEKGSISINGISLTVSNVGSNYFEVSILPHTLKNTNLKHLKQNDLVNIEYDMIAKYIQKFATPKKESKITKEFLIENGF